MHLESLKPAERELVFKLAREITGTAFSEPSRHEVIITNVIRRINATHCETLQKYLDHIARTPEELDHLISAMTIHTTSWFRELPHFRILENRLKALGPLLIGQKFRFLSAACSTGEELYSVGCILESFRRKYVGFEYELYGADLDPISLEKAKTGVYEIEKFDAIPRSYQEFFIYRKNISAKTFAVDAQIKKRSFFLKANLLEIDKIELKPFDLVFCRNVLIYFKTEEVETTVEKLFNFLKPNGYLSIGHCETFQNSRIHAACIGNSTYTKTSNLKTNLDSEHPMHILIVDDSKSVCDWVHNILTIHKIGCHACMTTEAASSYIREHMVDLVVLDFNLQGQNGLEWLIEQRKNNFQFPVILFTDVQANDAPQILDALGGVAQDYMNKNWVGSAPDEFVSRLKSIVNSGRTKFANLEKIQVSDRTQEDKMPFENADLILVGASTGGTEAMSTLLSQMPPNSPPVICVQHIPVEFSHAFFKRLCEVSGLQPGLCRQGQEFLPGHLYMPTVDAHIGIHQVGSRLTCHLSNEEKIWSQRPSVDFLFRSASFLNKKNIVAVLLTGMGKDGASGLLELKKNGAYTMAQDQNSSLVWGMPGEAYKLGAVQFLGNLHSLKELISSTISKAERAS